MFTVGFQTSVLENVFVFAGSFRYGWSGVTFGGLWLETVLRTLNTVDADNAHSPWFAGIVLFVKIEKWFGSRIQSNPPTSVCMRPVETLPLIVFSSSSGSSAARPGKASARLAACCRSTREDAFESCGRNLFLKVFQPTGGGAIGSAPKEIVNETTSRSTSARPPNGGPHI